MKLQKSLMTQNSANMWDIKAVIRSMKPELESSIGASLSQEVEGMLEKLGGMQDIFESNFSQIKEILDEIKNAITQEKSEQISQLEEQVRTDNLLIQELRIKEGQLIGKEAEIANLNWIINELKLKQYENCHQEH